MCVCVRQGNSSRAAEEPQGGSDETLADENAMRKKVFVVKNWVVVERKSMLGAWRWGSEGVEVGEREVGECGVRGSWGCASKRDYPWWTHCAFGPKKNFRCPLFPVESSLEVS